MTARDLALRTLNRLDLGQDFPEPYLDRAFKGDPNLSERDRAFTVHLVQGTFRWRLRLDWIIGKAVNFPFKNIEPPVLNILRIALFQILFMDRVPESAAVNEAVRQAVDMGRRHVAGFVNGILRNICRRKDGYDFPDRDNNPVSYLSIFYSYPPWLVKKWIREMGMDSAEHLLEAGNRIPGLVIRCNRLKIDRQGLITRLKEEGVTGKATPHAPEGLRISGIKGPVSNLKAFKEGLFQVQDEAAQVCSHLFSPGPGERVLDLCAGLGGKSTHIAQLTGDSKLVVALDISHNRLIRLNDGSSRLGIGCIHPVVADARERLSYLFRCSFDTILIDGPCSGLGTISRHPDGKWTKTEGHINRLPQLQKSLLNQAVPLLRKGGRMLYVTCTISRQENEDVVSSFMAENKGIDLENLKEHVPDWGLDLIDDHGFLKTLPHVHGMDGFFGALFTKE
ncbi:MAG: 16S rRNA (cytosine(967)-C(5))-methyltransferase RsmB [Deltaproteobacteria bacterium]|nr:16S rRNA (cytosine(967)-C(5))-methyltransferase RsmB [Deltaproteobacteria bacterium]